jgi:hypothetical protein
MRSAAVESVEERGTLALALAAYCAQNRINPDSEEYDDARQLLIMMCERLRQHTAADLKAALVAAVRGAR